MVIKYQAAVPDDMAITLALQSQEPGLRSGKITVYSGGDVCDRRPTLGVYPSMRWHPGVPLGPHLPVDASVIQSRAAKDEPATLQRGQGGQRRHIHMLRPVHRAHNLADAARWSQRISAAQNPGGDQVDDAHQRGAESHSGVPLPEAQHGVAELHDASRGDELGRGAARQPTVGRRRRIPSPAAPRYRSPPDVLSASTTPAPSFAHLGNVVHPPGDGRPRSGSSPSSSWVNQAPESGREPSPVPRHPADVGRDRAAPIQRGGRRHVARSLH